jgi:hypothetical protein
MSTLSSSSSNASAVAIAIPVVFGIVLIALLIKHLSRRQSQTGGNKNDPETLPKNSKCNGVHSPQGGTNRVITSPQHRNDYRSGLIPQLPSSAYGGQQYPARNVISNPMSNSLGRGHDYRWSGEQRGEISLLSQNQGVKFPVAAPAVLPATRTETQGATIEPFWGQDNSELRTIHGRLRTLETALINQPSGVSHFVDTADRPPAYELRPGSPRVDQGRMRRERA